MCAYISSTFLFGFLFCLVVSWQYWFIVLYCVSKLNFIVYLWLIILNVNAISLPSGKTGIVDYTNFDDMKYAVSHVHSLPFLLFMKLKHIDYFSLFALLLK